MPVPKGLIVCVERQIVNDDRCKIEELEDIVMIWGDIR